MAARRRQYQAGLCLDALKEGLIRRGVAGVKGDQHIRVTHLKIVDLTDDELEADEIARSRDAVAQVDKIAFDVDSGNGGLDAELIPEIVVCRECQIALAAAHIDDTKRSFVLQV